MIQRQQTLWLLLAAAAAILSFMFPFATGEKLVNGLIVGGKEELNAGKDFFILITTIASLCISIIAIAVFKDRKLQMKLCLLGLVFAVLIIILYISMMNSLTNPTLALFCIFPFLMAAGYLLAFRNIRKDEKLVKSLDKLR